MHCTESLFLLATKKIKNTLHVSEYHKEASGLKGCIAVDDVTVWGQSNKMLSLPTLCLLFIINATVDSWVFCIQLEICGET